MRHKETTTQCVTVGSSDVRSANRKEETQSNCAPLPFPHATSTMPVLHCLPLFAFALRRLPFSPQTLHFSYSPICPYFDFCHHSLAAFPYLSFPCPSNIFFPFCSIPTRGLVLHYPTRLCSFLCPPLFYSPHPYSLPVWFSLHQAAERTESVACAIMRHLCPSVHVLWEQVHLLRRRKDRLVGAKLVLSAGHRFRRAHNISFVDIQKAASIDSRAE